ncbi:MAG: glycoside hydrolase family 28 protein [Bacteroidaceae bacterium]|nr:glycoside hydrolase family 28 protein [Bacteroidaceae bacterium]
MNKRHFLPALALAALLLLSCKHAPQAETIVAEAPFPMPALTVPSFPDRLFSVTDYGAVSGLECAEGDSARASINTEAFARAISACAAKGGGHVVVPSGEWLCGPVHLLSNVDLHLSEGATLVFLDNPALYLPAVQTSWEGLECLNYSPLVYAFNCTNIAITGKGCLAPRMDTWRSWFGRPEGHYEALQRLYHLAAKDAPVEQRDMTAAGNEHRRPHLLQLNRCKDVLLEDFAIRESPFWTIHLLLCENATVRGLDVYAHGHNNDGIDLEMTRNVLVEDCLFDQGDDAVVIKSGRNHDAWRLHTPTENVVVRNCTVRNGHSLLGVGSEISGGVNNIYMHHVQCPDSIRRLFFLKTNHRRGGFIRNVTFEDIDANNVLRAFEIDTDVLYQWRDLVPTYDTVYTVIDSIAMRHVHVAYADAAIDLKGDLHQPVGTVVIDDVRVDSVGEFAAQVTNVTNLVKNDVFINGQRWEDN